jgi:HEPN domain-containing protein
MKDRADWVRGLLRKADSDVENARMCLDAGKSLDTACFHAQQAAEKALKAYLTANDVEFPFIHNIEKLVELCATKDEAFRRHLAEAQELTPYAVDLRYDAEFWPSKEETRRAVGLAVDFVCRVRASLPKEMRG